MPIYTPTGAAKEYSDLALNLYVGCQHGCTYCYAPSSTFKKREDFYTKVTLKKDIIERLEKDLKRRVKRKDRRTPVLLSFTCDPYQPIDGDTEATRTAIQMLNDSRFPVRILTKGGELAQRDFDLLTRYKRNEFGATVTLLNGWEEWEPYAAPPSQRIENLRKAKKMGIKTWMSLEPILDVDQAVEIIKMTHKFVDRYGVGKLNYNKHQKNIDWKDCRKRVEKALDKTNSKCKIHNTLKKA